METKARFALVGIFITVFLLIGIAIFIWVVGNGMQYKNFDRYSIYTKMSIAGLRKDSNVKYKGLNVGRVYKIEIDKNNPEYIKICIEVERDLPVKTDTKATISSNALTGIAYINLIKGSKNAKLLKDVSRSNCPAIGITSSSIEQLSQIGKDVFKKADELLGKINKVLNQQSMFYIEDSLKNLHGTIETTDKFVLQLSKTTNQLNRLIEQLSKNSNHLDSVIADTDKLLINTNELIRENRKNIKLFTNNGLENINSSFMEIHSSAKELRELLIELKNNPSLIIKGSTITKGPGE